MIFFPQCIRIDFILGKIIITDLDYVVEVKICYLIYRTQGYLIGTD